MSNGSSPVTLHPVFRPPRQRSGRILSWVWKESFARMSSRKPLQPCADGNDLFWRKAWRSLHDMDFTSAGTVVAGQFPETLPIIRGTHALDKGQDSWVLLQGGGKAQLVILRSQRDEIQPCFLGREPDANAHVRPAVAYGLGHAAVIAGRTPAAAAGGPATARLDRRGAPDPGLRPIQRSPERNAACTRTTPACGESARPSCQRAALTR